MLTSARREIPVRQLLAPQAAGPGAVDSDSWTAPTDTSLGDQPFTVTDSAQRIWRGPGSSDLREEVYRYRNPIWARLGYWVVEPEARDEYPKVHVLERPYHSSSDRSQVVCRGTVSNCYLWLYWAQYGQYVVEIRYSGDVRMNAEAFTRYVASIDEYVDDQLE